MSKLSQTQKVAEFLKTYPNKKFNAREIAEFIIQKYPEDYDQKGKIIVLNQKQSFYNKLSVKLVAEQKPIF